MRTTFEELADDIECEGFEYALVHYADYSNITVEERPKQ